MKEEIILRRSQETASWNSVFRNSVLVVTNQKIDRPKKNMLCPPWKEPRMFISYEVKKWSRPHDVCRSCRPLREHPCNGIVGMLQYKDAIR